MRSDIQIDLVRQLFAHIDNRTTALSDTISVNPVSAYSSTDRLKREQALLRSEPLLMGLSCQMPGPRDFMTDDNTGIPIIMVRGEDGKVRAFINACKHRGSRLLEGVGTVKKNLICPYHAWSYRVDGTLASVPHGESFNGFDAKNCTLTELSAAEENGLIWVRPTGDEAINLTEQLGGLSDEFESYDFGAYHLYETRKIQCKMNWKIIIDTFLEPYHFSMLHKNTVAPIFLPNLCLHDPFGRNLREVLPRRSISSLRDKPESEWDLVTHTALVYVLFPNTVFVMQDDHAEVWRAFPCNDRPGQSVVHLDFYIPEPATSSSAKRHWDNNMDLTIRTVIDEDFLIGQGAQRNYDSGGLENVIYGRNEPALAYFQRMIADAVGEEIQDH